jgi:hypothetical protein
MAFYPARDAVQKTIGFETADHQPTAMQHYSVTVVLFAIFLVFGVQIHSLGKVYSVVGGIASSFLAYIIPGFAYVAVFHPNWLTWTSKRYYNQTLDTVPTVDPLNGSALGKINAKPTWWLDIASIILIFFGLIVMSFTALGALH